MYDNLEYQNEEEKKGLLQKICEVDHFSSGLFQYKSHKWSRRLTWISYTIYIVLCITALGLWSIEGSVFNKPSIQEVQQPLDPEIVVDAPKAALGFVFGQNQDKITIINDEEIFEYKFEVIKVTDEIEEKHEYPLKKCDDLDWIGPPYSTSKTLNFLCPDGEYSELYKMSGIYLQSYIYQFPRFTISFCDPEKRKCKSQQQIQEIVNGGRVYFFTQKGRQINYNNMKDQQEQKGYNVQQYFLQQGLYKRAELQYQINKVKSIDFFYQSHTQYTKRQTDRYVQTSDVSFYNKQIAFYIQAVLQNSMQETKVQFDTILIPASFMASFIVPFFFIFKRLAYCTKKEKKQYKREIATKEFTESNFSRCHSINYK